MRIVALTGGVLHFENSEDLPSVSCYPGIGEHPCLLCFVPHDVPGLVQAKASPDPDLEAPNGLSLDPPGHPPRTPLTSSF
jgi:hypothetical protein